MPRGKTLQGLVNAITRYLKHGATVDEDLDGQLIIYTDCVVGQNDKLLPYNAESIQEDENDE